MASYDGFHWFKNILKKRFAFAFRLYLSIAISLSPIFFMNQANASMIGGWSLGGGLAQGASTVYDATKTVIQNGAQIVKKSTITITPTAVDVAKVLARGGATVALGLAVEQLLGGVDWVMDPANSQIVYSVTDPNAPVDPNSPKYQYFYTCPSNFAYICSYQYFSNAQAVARLFESENETLTRCDPPYYDVVQCHFTTGWSVLVDRITNTVYDPSSSPVDDNPKTLPLEVVAAQVISNAQSETDEQIKVGAQTATTAAAADIISEAETDETKARPISTQLDQAATNVTTETATGESTTTTNPETGAQETDLSLEFPTFCGWAPVVCEAAQTVLSFPQTLTNWWTTSTQAISAAWVEATEYFKEEPTQENTDFEIETPEFDAETVTLSATNQCPQDSVSFSLMGHSYNLELPYQPVCDALAFFKPAVLLVGAVTSLYIVAGIRTKEQEQ